MAHDAAFYAILFLCVVAVCFFSFVFRRQIRFLLKILCNTVLGAVLLILLNTFGASYGLGIGVNPVTAATVGILGVPGLIALYILKFLLH